MYFGMFYDSTFLVLIPAIIFSAIAQAKVSSNYRKYSSVANRQGITGFAAARRILDANGLQEIRLELTSGTLSDHFDSRGKVIRLSGGVYNGTSIAAVAIAAHECGHAIQYGRGYVPLKIRHAIAVPVNIASKLSWVFLIVGILVIETGKYVEGNMIFNIGVWAFAGVVLFQLVTLPVELNASRRAMKQVAELGLILPEERRGARKMLTAAAMTYVAALMTAVMQLVRILLLRGNRR